jgi:hypothetical protein
MQQLQDVVLDAAIPYHLEWCWTSLGQYTSDSSYRALFMWQHAIEGSKELWKIRVPNNDPCVLYSQCVEMIGHLLV